MDDGDNVVSLDVVTTVDIPLDKVLEGAKENVKSGLVILGWDEDGDMYFAVSDGAKSDVLWLLENAKQVLLEN